MSWRAPASNGGNPVTGYTVTSTPSGLTASTTGALNAVVPGLSNGTSYTFTVTALNVGGMGLPSAPSNAVTPFPPCSGTLMLGGLPLVRVGSSPNGIASGDFNVDGKLDLAISNSLSNDVSVLLGHGNGTFAPAVSFDAGPTPQAVAAADLSGDGKLDLVVSNGTANTVSVLIGRGDGTFLRQAPFDAGAGGPGALVAADFNNDGKADVATTNTNMIGGGVYVMLARDGGVLSNPVKAPSGGGPISIASGHFNADTNVDLAVACTLNNTITVLLGQGNGTFSMPISGSNNDQGFSSILTTDLDGDHHDDVAYAKSSGMLFAALGDGVGSIGTPKSSTQMGYRISAAGDFNGDTRGDLVLIDSTGDGVEIPSASATPRSSRASRTSRCPRPRLPPWPT